MLSNATLELWYPSKPKQDQETDWSLPPVPKQTVYDKRLNMVGIGKEWVKTRTSHFRLDTHYERTLGNFKKGDWKCNLFVEKLLIAAGIPPVYNPEEKNGLKWPLTANSWANKSAELDGWKTVTSPLPGDVVALKSTNRREAGHMGVVVGFDKLNRPIIVSARRDSVTEESTIFAEQVAAAAKAEITPTYRRYVGRKSIITGDD